MFFAPSYLHSALVHSENLKTEKQVDKLVRDNLKKKKPEAFRGIIMTNTQGTFEKQVFKTWFLKFIE